MARLTEAREHWFLRFRAAQRQRVCPHPRGWHSEEGTAGVPYEYCPDCGHIRGDDEPRKES